MLGGYKIRWSTAALADLMHIYSSIAENSAEHASGMVEQILSSIELLEIAPSRFRYFRRPRKGPPIRSLPVNPYIIYFRLRAKEKIVELLMIRHAARRRPRTFG